MTEEHKTMLAIVIAFAQRKHLILDATNYPVSFSFTDNDNVTKTETLSSWFEAGDYSIEDFLMDSNVRI